MGLSLILSKEGHLNRLINSRKVLEELQAFQGLQKEVQIISQKRKHHPTQ